MRKSVKRLCASGPTVAEELGCAGGRDPTTPQAAGGVYSATVYPLVEAPAVPVALRAESDAAA